MLMSALSSAWNLSSALFCSARFASGSVARSNPLEFTKREARLCMRGFNSCETAEPPQRQVDVARLDLETEGAPPGPFCSDKRSARTHEGIEYESTAPRAIEDRIFHQLDGLYGGMRAKRLRTFSAEAVHAGVNPHVGSVTAISAKFNIVDVRCAAILKDGYQFVLRSIERSHPSI